MMALLLTFGLLALAAVIAALLWKRRSHEPGTHHEQTYQQGADRGESGPPLTGLSQARPRGVYALDSVRRNGPMERTPPGL